MDLKKLRDQEKELMSIQFILDDVTEQLNVYKDKAKRPERTVGTAEADRGKG